MAEWRRLFSTESRLSRFRVHQDRGVEEDGKGQVEVEKEVGEDQGEPHMCDMRMT